jgi:hypothetical protein
MCTSIIEIARAEGMAKRGDEWFPLSQAVVAYDHARHAPLGDVITLDFINIALEPGARAGIELTAGDGQGVAPGDCCRRVRGGGSEGQGRRLRSRSGGVTRERGAAGWSELGERNYAIPASHIMGGALGPSGGEEGAAPHYGPRRHLACSTTPVLPRASPSPPLVRNSSARHQSSHPGRPDSASKFGLSTAVLAGSWDRHEISLFIATMTPGGNLPQRISRRPRPLRPRFLAPRARRLNVLGQRDHSFEHLEVRWI